MVFKFFNPLHLTFLKIRLFLLRSNENIKFEVGVQFRSNSINLGYMGLNAGFNLQYESTGGLKGGPGWYTVPDTKEWHEKLDHIESAVQQHVYHEEGSWLPDVIRYAPVSERQRMSTEYREYFGRVDLS